MLMLRLAGVLSFVVALSGRANAEPVTATLDYGPFQVGFRTVTELDRSRATQPRRAFDGRAADGETAMPIDIGIWYPATHSPAVARMSAEAYKTLRTPMTRGAVAADFVRMASFGGLEMTPAQATAALIRPSHAVRDATAADGRYPLVVSGSGLGTGWIRAEYLASHGYVVVAAPSSARTGTLQASQPAIALETQTRNLEFLLAFARQQPHVDATRLGILGVNFDGMAALVFEMRNMQADAIISLDGYEAKAGSVSTLRDSPFFDPLRLRVPYLLFVQDERDPGPALAHDRSLWRGLAYSTRFWYVLNGFNHLQLISDVANATTLSPEQQAGHRFILQTMRLFLDAYVKRDASAAARILKSSPGAGLPSSLTKVAERVTALPAVPDGEEFEKIVMSGRIDEAAGIYRAAKAANPEVVLFDEGTIGLYAFRYDQRKLTTEALELRRLAAEAFPESATAAHQRGIAAASAGNLPEARSEFERTLRLLGGSGPTGLSAARKDGIRRDIEKRLTALGGGP